MMEMVGKDDHLEDDDDDNDGYNDTEEITCASDPLDESSLPTLISMATVHVMQQI